MRGGAQKSPLLHGKHRIGHLAEKLLSLRCDPHQLVFPVVWHVLQLKKAALFQLLEGGVNGLLAEEQLSAQLTLTDTASLLPQGVEDPKGGVGQPKVPGQTVVDFIVGLV